MKSGKILPWLGAAAIVGMGAWYFLKVRPQKQQQELMSVMPQMGSNIGDQAIANIGSRRAMAFASRYRKMKKLRR